MDKVYLLYEYNVDSWSGHSWLHKVFRSKEAAEKYLEGIFGYPIKPHQETQYSDLKQARGFSLQEKEVEG